MIPDATDYFYLATQAGDYNVIVTDANGCEVEAVIFDVVASVKMDDAFLNFEIFYVEGLLSIRSGNMHGSAVVVLQDLSW